MASISWTFFVNFTVDGQRLLGLPLPSRLIASAHWLVFPCPAVPKNTVRLHDLVVPASSRSRDFAGLSFCATKNMVRLRDCLSLLSTA